MSKILCDTCKYYIDLGLVQEIVDWCEKNHHRESDGQWYRTECKDYKNKDEENEN